MPALFLAHPWNTDGQARKPLRRVLDWPAVEEASPWALGAGGLTSLRTLTKRS